MVSYLLVFYSIFARPVRHIARCRKHLRLRWPVSSSACRKYIVLQLEDIPRHLFPTVLPLSDIDLYRSPGSIVYPKKFKNLNKFGLVINLLANIDSRADSSVAIDKVLWLARSTHFQALECALRPKALVDFRIPAAAESVRAFHLVDILWTAKLSILKFYNFDIHRGWTVGKFFVNFELLLRFYAF